MDEHFADRVLFDLRHVVRNVIDDFQVVPELVLPRPADSGGDDLPVRESEIRCGGHRLKVLLAFGRSERCAGELTIGN